MSIVFNSIEDEPINDGLSYLSDDFIIDKGRWLIEFTNKCQLIIKCDEKIKVVDVKDMFNNVEVFSITRLS